MRIDHTNRILHRMKISGELTATKTDIGFKMTEAETEVIGTLDERVMEQLKHLFD